MDMKAKSPLDTLFATYNLLLAVVWLTKIADSGLGPIMAGVHLFLALLLTRIPGPDPRASQRQLLWRRVYPFALWALAWVEIGRLYELVKPPTQDGLAMSWDLLLFRRHLDQELSQWLPWSALSEFMHFTYLSYYLLILGPIVYLAWKNREALEQHTLNLMLTYLACFSIYLLLPVLGPRGNPMPGADLSFPVQSGFFAGLMMNLFHAGDSLGTAFPSSHCAASLAVALSARSFLSTGAARILLLWAILICFSTVYTGNHYAIDAAAGAGLALMVWRLRGWLVAWKAKVWATSAAVMPAASMIVNNQMGAGRKEENP